MPIVDLTRYIHDASGTWTDPSEADSNALFPFTKADTMAADRLMLRWNGDSVTLVGPLSIRVTVQCENMTKTIGRYSANKPATFFEISAKKRTAEIMDEHKRTQAVQAGAMSLHASTIYSYTLDIPAGQGWPFTLEDEDLNVSSAVRQRRGSEQLGNNLGLRVVIEPAMATLDTTPISAGTDLPCDFAVADRPNTAQFFPAACEPCEPGASIGLPPSNAVALVTAPAAGGCVRTRFFNGMFITREDLETEQRYHRLKSKLHNRAAGAGVVWGLNVGKQSGAVIVLPGYAVDCCGNDLTITTTYKVEMAALLADPAAAPVLRRGGAQRMFLLLEYIECPAEPRPVHGDPCSTDINRCEMSRIRESVRLRLVPPRDDETKAEGAPIDEFLDEVRGLRERLGIAKGTLAKPPSLAPFQLRVTLTTPDGRTLPAFRLRPSLSTNDPELAKLQGVVAKLTVDVELDPLWFFVHCAMAAKATVGDEEMPGIVDGKSWNHTHFPWFGDLPKTTYTLEGNLPREKDLVLSFEVKNWQTQNAFAEQDDPQFASKSALLTVTLNANGEITDKSLKLLKISAEPADLGDPPCEGDRCDVKEKKQFFLAQQHRAESLSTISESAGQPKALVLAALGAWLSQMLVREHEGTRDRAWTTRRMIASYIYSGAWLFLFGVQDAAEQAEAGEMLKRLFEAFCDGLLWKGPQCKGEPHGVVIGCAVVEGGAITNIDPFGGRRHVMHYPLLSHWGSQFGVTPPDVTASQFFSTLCCVSSLPAIGAQHELTATLQTIGCGTLALGAPNEIEKLLKKKKIDVVAERRVGTLEFIASVAEASQRTVKEKKNYTALVLGDFVADRTVMLLLPERT